MEYTFQYNTDKSIKLFHLPCEGITRIYMYQRSIQEIITVINEMESIEHIYVSSGDLRDELSSEYNQITFSVT